MMESRRERVGERGRKREDKMGKRKGEEKER